MIKSRLSGSHQKHELTLSGSHQNPSLMPDTNPLSGSFPPQPWDSHCVLNAAKSECRRNCGRELFSRGERGRRGGCASAAGGGERGSLVEVLWKFDGLLSGKCLAANCTLTTAPKSQPDTYQAVCKPRQIGTYRAVKLFCGSFENTLVNGKP